MIELGLFMFTHQSFNIFRAKEASVQRRFAQQQVVSHWFEIATKPMIQRDSEPHFLTHPDVIRQKSVKRLSKHPLARAPSELPGNWKRRSKFHQAKIQERLATFQAMSHRRNVDFGHEITR